MFNNVSLDGYFADQHGDMSWAKPPADDADHIAFVSENAKRGSTLLFGRVTYEMMAGFWPTPMAAQKKLGNLEGFLGSLERFEQREGHNLEGFLHRITLDTKDDDSDGAADQVTLVTLHGAKGLEFPVVFLVGCEEELIPHKRTLYPDGPDVLAADVDLGEERRLMYVGITRARELMYLTRARSRSMRAAAQPRSPSRFLAEIPPELYDARESSAPSTVATPEDEEAFARAALAKMFKMME